MLDFFNDGLETTDPVTVMSWMSTALRIIAANLLIVGRPVLSLSNVSLYHQLRIGDTARAPPSISTISNIKPGQPPTTPSTTYKPGTGLTRSNTRSVDNHALAPPKNFPPGSNTTMSSGRSCTMRWHRRDSPDCSRNSDGRRWQTHTDGGPGTAQYAARWNRPGDYR